MQIIFLNENLRLALSNLSESKMHLYMHITSVELNIRATQTPGTGCHCYALCTSSTPPHYHKYLPRRSYKLLSFAYLHCGCILGAGQLLCLTYIRWSYYPHLHEVISKRSVSWLLASSQLLTGWLCHSLKCTLPGPVCGDSHCLASTSWRDKVRQSVLLQGSSRVQIVFLLRTSSGYKHNWPLT